ncbi:MAG: bifunctional aminoglycoside phosphotransferase/ATP-binding protein [Actinomycetes bacterium]
MNGGTAPYADLHETHSGVVLLLGDVAYKLKKPVTLPFLDYSTTARRREACERELVLNRRFSPDVYLGVGALTTPSGESEPTVMMRRMPADRRLSAILDHADTADSVREVARLVARFHSGAERSQATAAEGRRDEVLRRCEHNLDEAARLPGTPISSELIAAVRSGAERYLAGREVLFQQRIEEGRVLDGHGDLLADDIFCLPDGPRVLDCLEFDDRLRHLDQIDDVACLAMDLERLGHAELAGGLLRWYSEFSGDHAPASLIHHYIAYRAFMRAKVSAVRRQEPGPHPASGEEPVALARLARDHIDAAAVRLVLIGGPPGSGKSTLAGHLSRRLGLAVLDSDSMRKELVGLSARSPAAAGFEEGIYSPASTARTYGELLRRAQLLLERGESVLLDASWSSAHHRAQAARLADAVSAELISLRCDLPAAVADVRIAARRVAGDAVSDADHSIAARMRSRQDVWPESVRLDTARDLAETVDEAVDAVLRGAAGTAGSSGRPISVAGRTFGPATRWA